MGPGYVEVRDGLEGDFCDDAESAKGEEGGAEEGGIAGRTAGDEVGVGEENGEGSDRLGEEAMFEARAVGAGADAAGDGLNVDGAQVGKG